MWGVVVRIVGFDNDLGWLGRNVDVILFDY